VNTEIRMEEGRVTRRRQTGILRNSHGVGTFGCIFSLLLFGGAVYVAYLFGLALYEYNSFEQAVAERMPYFKFHEAEYIHGVVMEIANKDFNLGLKEEQVKVKLEGNRIFIDISYEQQVVLPFYTHKIKFSPHFTGAQS